MSDDKTYTPEEARISLLLDDVASATRSKHEETSALRVRILQLEGAIRTLEAERDASAHALEEHHAVEDASSATYSVGTAD